MNGEIEQRLKELWRQLGLSVEDGSVSCSMLLAYAYALGLISDEYDGIFADLFESSASVRGIAMLSDLINSGSSKADIEAYFSSTPKMLSKSAFEEAAGIFDYRVENKAFIFSYSGTLDFEIIQSISSFIANYMPVYMSVSADGGGLTFDEFDSIGLFWYQADEAALPFSVIDSLKYN